MTPDEARERAINLHYRLMCSATTRAERHRQSWFIARLYLERALARFRQTETRSLK